MVRHESEFVMTGLGSPISCEIDGKKHHFKSNTDMLLCIYSYIGYKNLSDSDKTPVVIHKSDMSKKNKAYMKLPFNFYGYKNGSKITKAKQLCNKYGISFKVL